MRFILDEGLPFRLASYLRREDYDVATCGRDHPQSLDDRDFLAIAFAERRVVPSKDKDVGDLDFHDGLPHAGVILIRLGYAPIEVRGAWLRRVPTEHEGRLDRFFVVSPQGIRIDSG